VRRPTSRQRRPPVFRRLSEAARSRQAGRKGRGGECGHPPALKMAPPSLCPFTPAAPGGDGTRSSAGRGVALQLPASPAGGGGA